MQVRILPPLPTSSHSALGFDRLREQSVSTARAGPEAHSAYRTCSLATRVDALLRGLIQSDGCRHRRVVNGTNYPAYSFSNRSEDILGLFAWGCNLMGVRWRRANRTTISIARRREVALLDQVLGASDV